MSNRKRIEQFCKKNEIEIITLGFERYSGTDFERPYIDWELKCKLPNHIDVVSYNSFFGCDTTADDVTFMLDNIVDDLNV